MAQNTFGGTPADVLTDQAGNVIPDYPLLVRVAGTGELITALFEADGITPIGELRTNPAGSTQPGAVRPFKCAQSAIEYECNAADGSPVRWYQVGREVATSASATAAAAQDTANAALPRTGGTLTGKVQSEAASSSATVDASFVTGDAHDRYRRDAAGRMDWGPGNAARDVTLYRSGPGELTIEGDLVVTGQAPGASGQGFDPRAYGALGDGIANDSAAIQSALNDAYAAGGGWVIVPPGDYLAATLPLRIYRGTRLTLMPGARIMRGANGTMLLNGEDGQNLGGYTGHGDLIIEGGVWDSRAVDFPSSGMVISIGHAERVTIRDTVVRDVCGYHAIELNSTRVGRVLNCSFEGYLDPGGRGFSEAVQVDLAGRSTLFGGFGPYDHTVCDDVVMRSCYVGASGTAGTMAWPTGVGSHSTTHDHPHKRIAVVENVFDGLAQHAVKAYCWDDLVIARNRVTNCGAGVWLRTLDSSKVADRTDENGVDTGLSAPNTGGVIEGNIFRGCTGHDAAIAIEGETSGIWTDVNVSGNVVDGTAGSTHGVRMYYADQCMVSGNILTGIGGTAVSTAQCVFGAITANRAHDCGSSFITCDTDTDMLIADNHLALCQTHGVWLFGGGRLKVANNYVRGAGRADGTGNGFRVTSSLARLTLTGNTYQAWGSGQEAGTAIYISSSITGVRRFGNDVLGQAATEVNDTSTTPNLSPYDAGTHSHT